MNRDVLIGLSEKVESARGPDRILDVEIWCAVHDVDFPKGPYESMQADYDEDPTGKKENLAITRDGLLLECYKAKTANSRYTSSLDAAMLLIPEGWRWWKAGDRRTGGSRMVVADTADDGRFTVIGECPCPDTVDHNALALLSACLRARAAETAQ
jgi:hypothetical protein